MKKKIVQAWIVIHADGRPQQPYMDLRFMVYGSKKAAVLPVIIWRTMQKIIGK